MLRFVSLLLCLGAFVSLSQAAAIKEFDDQWENFKENENMSPDVRSNALEDSRISADLPEVEDGEEEKTDPRLHRKKRQAIYPFYPAIFSTRRSRRRSRFAYAFSYPYSYYTYPYFSYPYAPFAPFYNPGVLPGVPPTTTNVPGTAAATAGSCGCDASDTNCLSNCYYNQYLQGLGG